MLSFDKNISFVVFLFRMMLISATAAFTNYKETKLVASDKEADAFFGMSVALDVCPVSGLYVPSSHGLQDCTTRTHFTSHFVDTFFSNLLVMSACTGRGRSLKKKDETHGRGRNDHTSA